MQNWTTCLYNNTLPYYNSCLMWPLIKIHWVAQWCSWLNGHKGCRFISWTFLHILPLSSQGWLRFSPLWLPLEHQRHSGWLPFPNCLGGCFTLLAQQDTGVQTRQLSRLQPDLWAPSAERKTDGCNSFILHTVVLWLKLSCFRLLPLTDMRDKIGVE